MANKKMTTKEFKEVLKAAHIDFDFIGWEGILVIISNHYYNTAKEFEEKNLKYGADDYKKNASKIHEILEERGYFEGK